MTKPIEPMVIYSDKLNEVGILKDLGFNLCDVEFEDRTLSMNYMGFESFKSRQECIVLGELGEDVNE